MSTHERRNGERRGLRKVTASAVAGIALLTAACSSPSESGPTQPTAERTTVAGYLPTYIGEAALAGMAGNHELMGDIDRLSIAFATPSEDGGVDAPVMPEGFSDVVDVMRPDAQVVLGVGGWSIDDSRETMERNLRTVFDDPEHFVDELVKARDHVAGQLNRKADTIGFAVDLEWPQPDEKEAMSEIIESLDAAAPNSTITVAIPTGSNRAGYDLSRIAPHVEAVESMTYDYTVFDGSGNGIAGYNAPPDAVKVEIDDVVAQLGDASKVLVGFPAYGPRFPGAIAIGDSYAPDDKGPQLQLKDVPVEQIDDKGLAMVDGALVSLVSPDMVRATMAAIREKHPAIGGGFTWSLDGATPDFIDAMRG